MYQKFLLSILAQKFKCKKVVHMNDEAPIKKGLAIWFLFGSFYIPKVSNARLSCPFPLVIFFLSIHARNCWVQAWPAAIICIHDQQPWPAGHCGFCYLFHSWEKSTKQLFSSNFFYIGTEILMRKVVLWSFLMSETSDKSHNDLQPWFIIYIIAEDCECVANFWILVPKHIIITNFVFDIYLFSSIFT